MLVDKKIRKKLQSALGRYANLDYEVVAEVPMKMAQTEQHFRSVPEGIEWKEAVPGTGWGGRWLSAWFAGKAALPPACDGREVFVCAQTGGIETLLFVDGIASGLLNSYAVGQKDRPHHAAKRITAEGKSGQGIELALEAYAGHPCVGSQPNGDGPEDLISEGPYRHTFQKVQLLLRNDDIRDFCLDLRTLLSLLDVLDHESLRQGKLMAGLARVYQTIHQMPDEVPESLWRPALAEARVIMKPLLQARNGDTTPLMALTGHSHLDTAWKWTIDETIRKAARTFSTALSMLDQYPEYRFLQSAPCHADFMRTHYPEIYARIREAVASGRWEMNGGMWVEPDCNIPSGESMVRQFLLGQAFTQKEFGVRSDSYWQPDVFGYSAAIPQIMRGCGVRFFLTTKIAWNDTNRFPYDTFKWKGLDGTEVIVHFNDIHCWPEPKKLVEQWGRVQHKDVQDRKLTAYGFGDGGGGPQDEMIEMSRRVVDLEGCPRTKHMSVSEFMCGVERDLAENLPSYQGELYLEAHRGTLTSISQIKRGNRKAELALRDAEWACSLARALGHSYPADKLEELWKVLLINQFHDILPGSSMNEVNDRAIKELGECRAESEELCRSGITSLASPAQDSVTLANTLSWAREGEIALSGIPEGRAPAGDAVVAQGYEDVEGQPKLAVTGLAVPSLGMISVPLREQASPAESPFVVDGPGIDTPFADVQFDERGRMASFIDRTTGRQLVREGGAFNVFWCGEDIPQAWDNWDIDPDQSAKMRDDARLISQEVVGNGPLQLRIRSRFAVGVNSTITQDIVFHSTSPRVDFETLVDWHEKHKLLKAGFDTTILSNDARHEIQFGHLMRPTHQNLSTDRARFEVCNHKWTDLSENRQGIALLNDCKYGISVSGGDMRISLIKSGTHPDYRADEGVHRMDYALLPHAGGFAAENVVRPAYEFNSPVIALPGFSANELSLASVSAPNVIVESVKQSEDGSALILRLYEAEKTYTPCTVTFGLNVSRVEQTNMLEEEGTELPVADNAVSASFRPFEIKTLRVELGA